jgi:hypothetical protein
MPKPITLRFIFLTLLRLKHETKIEPNGPQTLADILVKNRWGRPSQLKYLAQFLSATAARMRQLMDERQFRLECSAVLSPNVERCDP